MENELIYSAEAIPRGDTTHPLFIGCCGWGEARSKYFSHFQVVELQSTFYEPPSLELANKWRSSSPDSFQFCLKAWQLITHTPSSPTFRRLKSALSPTERDLIGSFRPTEQVWLAWERTAAVARAVRAPVVLFQCPASLRPEQQNIKNLRDFFSQINRETFSLAWEPRGEWPLDLVQGLCKELCLLHCLDPLQTGPAKSTYWRLHGRGGYSYRYSDDDLIELKRMLLETRERGPGPAYVLFNNIWMKDDALRFQLRMGLPSGL